MPFGLFIEITGDCPFFAPDVSDCLVLVGLDGGADASREIKIEFLPNVTEREIASVLSALQRFFEGEQFRSIDFEKGIMLVEHRARTGQVSLVRADTGCLREDGILEFVYGPPHK